MIHFCIAGENGPPGEYGLVQYFDATIPIHEIDNIFNCVCPSRPTDVQIDHIIDFNKNELDKLQSERWFGLVVLSAVIAVFHIARSNNAVPPFSPQIQWRTYHFYVNRFY